LKARRRARPYGACSGLAIWQYFDVESNRGFPSFLVTSTSSPAGSRSPASEGVIRRGPRLREPRGSVIDTMSAEKKKKKNRFERRSILDLRRKSFSWNRKSHSLGFPSALELLDNSPTANSNRRGGRCGLLALGHKRKPASSTHKTNRELVFLRTERGHQHLLCPSGGRWFEFTN